MSPKTMTGPEWWALWQRAGEPKLKALDVACRTCGAPAGRYCRRPSGHKAMSAHAVRWDDALRLAAGESLPAGREHPKLFENGAPRPQEGSGEAAA